MDPGRDTPERASRGAFGIRTSIKAVESSEQPTGTSTSTSGSIFDTPVPQQGRRDRIGSSLRRNSSRLLSLIRGRDSSNVVKAPNPEPGSPSRNEQQPGDGSVSLYSPTAKDTLASQRTAFFRENPRAAPDPKMPHTPTSRPPLDLSTPSPSDNKKQDEVHQDAARTHSRPQNITVNDDRNPCVQQSQSAPNLAAVLSNKLSTTFANTTVIHRTNLRSRPSVRAVYSPQPEDPPLSKQGDNTADSPNSLNPSGGSCWSSDPNSNNSTPPTSNDSNTPPDSSKSFNWKINAGKEDLSQNAQQTKPQPIQELPETSPSIITAEAAANAKIYLETHFNRVYSHVDARSQRQSELEKYLLSRPIPPEEQELVWRKWIRQEREYLRQYRVLKTPRTRHRNKSPVANYEIVKTLGNGSFGVVSLVKERRNEGSRCSLTEDDPRLPARRRVSGPAKVYAMKIIRKSDMLRTSQEAHLRAERDFLVASANSRWIVPLVASFQDNHNLYLVLEYMIGGDFLGLLFRKGILPENMTRWYVAEMILCVEEAHKLLWIHRDIKPDNFLISASGHLKIADFGLAFDGHWSHDQQYYNKHRYSLIKKLGIRIDGDATDQKEEEQAKQESKGRPSSRTAADDLNDEPPAVGVLGWRDRHQRRKLARSVVGTSQYMAPEVVRGKLYDGRCDWWSIGIILYECFYGFTPFVSDDRLTTKLKILNHHQILHFPIQKLSDKLVPADAIDLIGQLLQEKEYRLTARSYRLNDLASRNLFYHMDSRHRDIRGAYVCPNDASDIKSHPFFRTIKWDTLHVSTPPFIPLVRGLEDTSYFDDGEYSMEGETSKHSETGDTDGHAEVKTAHEAPAKAADASPAEKTKTPSENRKQKKKKERARDKILRDDQVGGAVLKMRKQDAFLGYTYRRPKPVAAALHCERGRPLLSRRHLSDIYGC